MTFDQAPIGMAIVAVDGKLLRVNTAFCQTLGYTAEELLQLKFAGLTHPDDLTANLNLNQKLLRDEIPNFQMEKHYLAKDGRVISALLQVGLVRNAHGEPLHFISQIVDITARKQAEAEIRGLNVEMEQRVIARTQALQESEERFRQLAENIAENINEVFWLDAADLSRTLYLSPAFESIWGRSRESLYENPQFWQEAIDPADRERVRSILQKWLDEGKRETYSAEYRMRRPDGMLRWIWNRAFPIHNEAGEIYRIAGIAEDITARKNLEEQLLQHTENLEKLVEARAQRIRQLEKLQVENEKLAATGRMAARIAHEVNNPLAGIQGAFQLVKSAIPGEHKYFKFVARIENEIEYIARIIRQMFDLHQPEKDAVRRFRFDEVIQDILALVKAGLREGKVTIEHDIQPATFEVTMHQNLLRQVLYNVVQNAIDASPADGVVKLAIIGEAARVTITVADQGPGIPEEVRSRIFEPFFTTKSGFSKSGLGLGLSVSKSIVESMGGTIDFASRRGEGTAFRIIVPTANDFKSF